MKTIQEGGRPIHIWADHVEESAMEQLVNVANLPFIHKHGVAAMPDVHWGIGATVGSVIATRGAIIPAAVGVDIGCGMHAVRLNMKANLLPDTLRHVRGEIEKVVPLGTGGGHGDAAKNSSLAWLLPRYPSEDFRNFLNDRLGTDMKKQAAQLGTLGSGNHFIEMCIDENQDVWIMLHSGSRGIGNKIGRYFIDRAKEEMQKHFIELADPNLAYLPENTPLFRDYVEAIGWAQDYALANRAAMSAAVLAAVGKALGRDMTFMVVEEAVNCHHNYVEQEAHYGQNAWITRKGAIRARAGDLGIIPGSMGAKSYIVRGLGNDKSYHSCSHGAGRALGRKQARERFTVDDLIKQTKGVECRKDDAVLDELPSAYKDIDAVMEQQRDLVEIVHTLKQIVCVKGA